MEEQEINQEYDTTDIYEYLEDFHNRLLEIINNAEKVSPDKRKK